MPYVPATFLITFIVAAAAGVWLSLPGLAEFTLRALDWCESILMLCLPYEPVLKAIGFFSGVVLLASGLALSLTRGISGWTRGLRAMRRLPVYNRGLSVSIIKDDNIRTAFTHGLIRPRIYVSTGLLKNLTREELRAVLLHEVHHRDTKDPLRFFCLSLIKDLFFYLPVAAWFVRQKRSQREIEADDEAIVRTGQPLTLAGALVKVARPARYGLSAQPASIAGSGPVEDRVRRILFGKDRNERLPLSVLAKSAFFALVLILSVTLPVSSAWHLPDDCTMEHCSHHMEMVNGCRTHCDMTG